MEIGLFFLGSICIRGIRSGGWIKVEAGESERVAGTYLPSMGEFFDPFVCCAEEVVGDGVFLKKKSTFTCLLFSSLFLEREKKKCVIGREYYPNNINGRPIPPSPSSSSSSATSVLTPPFSSDEDCSCLPYSSSLSLGSIIASSISMIQSLGGLPFQALDFGSKKGLYLGYRFRRAKCGLKFPEPWASFTIFARRERIEKVPMYGSEI